MMAVRNVAHSVKCPHKLVKDKVAILMECTEIQIKFVCVCAAGRPMGRPALSRQGEDSRGDGRKLITGSRDPGRGPFDRWPGT